MCLYLPRHAEEAAVDDRVEGATRCDASGEGEVVLVIDDDPTIRMLVAELLAESGYAVIEASDGPAGLKVLNSNARIDLLITDVGLPGGLNGRQVAEAARVSRPNLKVLFITGYAENAVIGQGRLENGMFVMTKPFQMEHLAHRIREIIKRQSVPTLVSATDPLQTLIADYLLRDPFALKEWRARALGSDRFSS